MLARTNNNAYELASHGEYSVSAIFKVSNLSFDISLAYSRMNPLKRKGIKGHKKVQFKTFGASIKKMA